MHASQGETATAIAAERPRGESAGATMSESARMRQYPNETEAVEPAGPSSALPAATSIGRQTGSGSPALQNAAGSEDDESPEDSAGAAPDPEQDEAPAGTQTEQASLYVPRGAMPAPLRGSLESLERQNEKLEAEGLERIEDETDLANRIADGVLVPVPESSGLTINAALPAEHRYCRPWTARFLANLAHAHDAAFHRPLEVSSAVRTVAYQRRLMWTNGNAAPAEGDVVSPHLTGATVDIAKSGMSRSELAWMRRQLLALEDAGKIDVEEEFHQSCFHITVYKTYAPSKTLRAPLKATSPANPPQRQPEPSHAGAVASTTGA
jgi:hypothetical protein